MRRGDYYELLKELARNVRTRYQLTTRTISLSAVRGIYKHEGIKLEYWHRGRFKRVRAAYLLVDGGPHVLINGNIRPKEPKLFSLCHELKHHYVDQDVIKLRGVAGCQEVSWADASPLEIGAEIFAAELIYPESEFLEFVKDFGIKRGSCSVEQVIELKRECRALVSYTFLRKRLEWFRFVEVGAFARVQFQKLEEQRYGVPWYRRQTPRRS